MSSLPPPRMARAVAGAPGGAEAPAAPGRTLGHILSRASLAPAPHSGPSLSSPPAVSRRSSGRQEPAR
eukprot:5532285-Pyramimonas_sp.AAC.1